MNVPLSFSGSGLNFAYEFIRSVQFIFVDRFSISLMVEELFLLNQENPYVIVQLMTTRER